MARFNILLNYKSILFRWIGSFSRMMTLDDYLPRLCFAQGNQSLTLKSVGGNKRTFYSVSDPNRTWLGFGTGKEFGRRPSGKSTSAATLAELPRVIFSHTLHLFLCSPIDLHFVGSQSRTVLCVSLLQIEVDNNNKTCRSNFIWQDTKYMFSWHG